MSDMFIDGIIVPKPPCDGCRYANLCKSQRTACHAFVLYAGSSSANRGKEPSRVPNRRDYLTVFPGEIPGFQMKERSFFDQESGKQKTEFTVSCDRGVFRSHQESSALKAAAEAQQDYEKEVFFSGREAG